MKKINEKVSKAKPRVLGKAGLLAVLMFLSATTGWAREQWAKVVRIIDTPQADGSTTTQVMLTRQPNGQPNMSISIFNSDRALYSILLKEYLAYGVEITYDDEGLVGSGFPVLNDSALLSINGIDILDIFPDLTFFKWANQRRAEAARQNQQRGGR